MFHLGVWRRCRRTFLSEGGFHPKHYPADEAGSTACAVSQNQMQRRALLNFFRIARSPISSPVRQNAAALLFELVMVDIR
jgi:hypothetical protein